MKILEFRYLTTEDRIDTKYDFEEAGVHTRPWSRLYEYPVVIDVLKDFCNEESTIHNSSWGFGGVHVTFKEELESLFEGRVENSDIKPSSLDNTFIYDITKEPSADLRNKYDVVINVSTLEEVNSDHIKVFNNLYSQVKEGGLFVATFDLPGLQIKRFEELFGRQLEINGTILDGSNSFAKNQRYSHLNVGLMVIQKSS